MNQDATTLFELESPPAAETVRERHTSSVHVPSLLKWTGSKRSQAAKIAAYAPHFNRYYEPFLGGGAVLYLLGRPGAVAGDIYGPLIAFWSVVRDEPESLISDYTTQWRALQDDLPAYYYLVRDRFNEHKRPEDLNFLMRTCVNGIVRFSRSGDFNNSFHLSRKGMTPSKFAKIVRTWTVCLRGIQFCTEDFENSTATATKGDFVYLDPPYGGNKQRYIENLDVDRFCRVLEDYNHRGVKWALSFDGTRGHTTYDYTIPADIYKRRIAINSGYSAVSKVLNGPVELVTESLYLNY